MQLEQRKIDESNAGRQLMSLYQTAFPVGEQMPWDDLLRLVGEMPLDFTAYYDGETLIGFTIVYPSKTFNWLWYFAVEENLRGKGYGQEILSSLLDKYKGKTCVLDMESTTQDCANMPQRKRRRDFYARNGFMDTFVYRTYNGITMTMMTTGPGRFSMDDWNELVGELKKWWWSDEFDDE